MVGNGVKRLIERAVPEGTTAEDREAVYATFRTFYLQHSQDHTRPYPGIMAMLAALHAAGCQMAVVSNKMQAATQQLVSRFFAPYISVAVGEDEATGIRRKPAPDMVAEALRQLGARAADAVYVGDSDVDIATATNSGLPCISVLWGFRDRQFLLQHGATRLVEQPDDIVKLFSK